VTKEEALPCELLGESMPIAIDNVAALAVPDPEGRANGIPDTRTLPAAPVTVKDTVAEISTVHVPREALELW